MTRIVSLLACGFAMTLGSMAGAGAQDVFNMTGTWSWTGKGIVDGLAVHHPLNAPAKSADTHRLTEVAFTLKVEGQDDNRFWGTLSSPSHVDKIIGAVSADGKQIHIVTPYGFTDGIVKDNDTIDTCYRQIQPNSAVVGCNTYKRTGK